MDLQWVVLIVSAFLTATLSGIVGMGGGITLLAVMEMFLPGAALIPIHGAVQLMSNGTRAFLHLKHIKWSICIPILVGVLFGALLASSFVTSIQSRPEFKLVLALFILGLTWKPKFKMNFIMPGKFYIAGFISGWLSMLFGSTGPFLAPFFLNVNLNRFQIISTKAVAQLGGHFLKVIVFSTALGFSFYQYRWLVILMAVAVVGGTYFGKKILHHVNDKLFVVIFKSVITILCLRMLIIYFLGR